MLEPQKFRKKPVVVEAIQWTGDNLAAIYAFRFLSYFTSEAT